MLEKKVGLTVVAPTPSHDLKNSLKFNADFLQQINADLQQHAKHKASVLLTIHKGKGKGKCLHLHRGKLLC